MNRRDRQSGFTMIEILVATVMVIVTSLMAMPAVSTLLQHYRLGNTTNQVAFEISRARMQAVAQNRFVKLRAETDTNRVCRQTSSTSSGPWTPTTCTGATDAIRLDGGTAVSGTLPVFDRTGTATAPVSISLQNSAGQMTIRVGILGRVTIS